MIARQFLFEIQNWKKLTRASHDIDSVVFQTIIFKNQTGMIWYKPRPSFILNYLTKTDNKKLLDLCHCSNVAQSRLHFCHFIKQKFTSVKVLQSVKHFLGACIFFLRKTDISSLIDCCCLWYVRLKTKSSLLYIFESVVKEAVWFEISKFSDNILLGEIFASCVYHFLSLAYKSLNLSFWKCLTRDLWTSGIFMFLAMFIVFYGMESFSAVYKILINRRKVVFFRQETS